MNHEPSVVPTITPSPVRGVLFDLGGTLYGYGDRRALSRAGEDALRRMGLDPDAPEVRTARRSADEEVSRTYATRPYFLHRDMFRDRLVATARSLGVDPAGEVLDRFDIENVRVLVDHLTPEFDAATTLRKLRTRGVYRAIVSNADDAWLAPVIRRHGLHDLVEHWTSSEEAESCKPDSRIFTRALAKAGLDPAQVLFVGDSIAHDVVGANAAGMRTVLIDGHVGPAPFSSGLAADLEPDHRIARLGEVVEIVDELNGQR